MADVIDFAAREVEAFTNNCLEAVSHQASLGCRYCENCGVEIPLERRQAMPSARLCVDCQEEAEKWKS